ncbi:MAG: hypothetical protein ACKV2Q_12465 [Planctomycetaceae bacterium]
MPKSATQTWPTAVPAMLSKRRDKTDDYVIAYDHPDCHRTSNLVDRLMSRLYRLMDAGRGLHCHQCHSELRLRDWALLWNFPLSLRAPALPKNIYAPLAKILQAAHPPNAP